MARSSYHRLLRVLAAVLVAMTVLPTLIWVAGHPSKGELFPLSRWAMFNQVFSVKTDYGLRILSIAGNPVAPPVYFEKSLLPTANSMSAYFAIQTFAKHVSAGGSNVAADRALVEQQYLNGKDVEYELVSRKWDPIARWSHGEFEQESVLATFRAGAPP